MTAAGVVQCVRVDAGVQCPLEAAGVVAVAFYPFRVMMEMHQTDKPLRRLILALPMCAAHQANAALEELMLPSSLAAIIRAVERETTLTVDPKGIKVIPVPFDDPDYLTLEALRRQARARQQRADAGVTTMKVVRAKVTCESLEGTTVKFRTVYEPDSTKNDENARFTQATPWGTIELGIDNPAAREAFEVGKSYYVDFSPAESAAAVDNAGDESTNTTAQ